MSVPMLDLRLIKCFLEVADARSFTAAAQRLDIAQSAASTNVRRLEDVLGFPLFARTSRKVLLTAEGRTFLPHAQELVAAEAATSQAALAIRTTGSRHIRFGTYDFLGKARSRALGRYIARYPNDRVTINYGAHAELLSQLQSGKLDVTIGLAARDERGAGIDIHPLWPLFGHLVVGPADPLYHEAEVRLRMLSGRRVVVMPSTVGAKAINHVTSLLRAQGVRLVEAEETDRDASDAYARVRGLLHMRWLAHRKARYIKDGWAIIPFADEEMQMDVAAMSPAGEISVVQRFLDAVADTI